MAYDENLADRVRQVLTRCSDIEERAMFGGLAFMARGHMCCGLVKHKLMLRVSPDSYDRLLREAGVQPMDFTGEPMRGFLYVTGPGLSTSTGLRTWVKRALDFAESRPPKTKTARRIGAKSTQRPSTAQQPTGRPRNTGKNAKQRSGMVRS